VSPIRIWLLAAFMKKHLLMSKVLPIAALTEREWAFFAGIHFYLVEN